MGDSRTGAETPAWLVTLAADINAAIRECDAMPRFREMLLKWRLERENGQSGHRDEESGQVRYGPLYPYPFRSADDVDPWEELPTIDMPAKYAILAAIHQNWFPGSAISPWVDTFEAIDEAAPFAVLCSNLEDAREADEPLIRECLAEIKHDRSGAGGAESRPDQSPATVSHPPASENSGKTLPRAELKPRFERAYQAMEVAKKATEKDLTIREAHKWLEENGPEEYELPAFETFARYVGHGRTHHGTTRNKPRGGRTGGSIIKAREQDYRDRSDSE